MSYRGYTLYVHPTWTQFGRRICFIKQGGLSVTKRLGADKKAAIKAAKKWVDNRLNE